MNNKRKNYFGFFDFRLLKKNYCPKCGQKYKLKILTYRKQKEYKVFLTYNTYTNIYYFCNQCSFYMNYKNQKHIARLQKEYGNNIVDNAKSIIDTNKIQVKKEKDYYVLVKESSR